MTGYIGGRPVPAELEPDRGLDVARGSLITQDDIPESVDGLAARGFETTQTGASVLYADSREGYSQSFDEHMAAGDVLLSIGDFSSDPIFKPVYDIRDMYGDELESGRVFETTVGDYPAIVSWSAPTATGTRTHHVLWRTSKGVEFNIEGVRDANEMVRLARLVECG